MVILRWVMGRFQRDQEFSIPGFPGRDFAQSRDLGIFWDGISLKFYPRIFPKKNGNGQISQIIYLQMENFVVLILYLVYFAIKYMYFENLWVKSSEFPHFQKFVNMVGTLCAERGRRHVVLIFGNLRKPCSLHFRIFVKTHKMNLFAA